MNAYYVSHSELSTEEIAVNEKYNLCPHRIYSLKENKSINEKKKKSTSSFERDQISRVLQPNLENKRKFTEKRPTVFHNGVT